MVEPRTALFERINSARRRLIDVRARRVEMVLLARSYFRTALADFIDNCDPITGMRFAEVTADGNKTTGDMAVTIAFFQGMQLTIGVDHLGRFTSASTPHEIFGDIGEIVDLVVAPDHARAEVVVASPTGRRPVDLGPILDALVAAVVEVAEAEAPPPVRELPRAS